MSLYQDPFSLRAEGIARQAIEELYDSIYYLTRQVAKLEDLREKLASLDGDKIRRGTR